MRGAHASVCKSARSHYSLLDFMYPVELIRDTSLNLITSGSSAGGFQRSVFSEIIFSSCRDIRKIMQMHMKRDRFEVKSEYVSSE